MATASSKQHRQPRLRASCDGCFLAKVKCSKARPICSRCLACGIECRYSPSSRAGKPKATADTNSSSGGGSSHHGGGSGLSGKGSTATTNNAAVVHPFSGQLLPYAAAATGPAGPGLGLESNPDHHNNQNALYALDAMAWPTTTWQSIPAGWPMLPNGPTAPALLDLDLSLVLPGDGVPDGSGSSMFGDAAASLVPDTAATAADCDLYYNMPWTPVLPQPLQEQQSHQPATSARPFGSGSGSGSDEPPSLVLSDATAPAAGYPWIDPAAATTAMDAVLSPPPLYSGAVTTTAYRGPPSAETNSCSSITPTSTGGPCYFFPSPTMTRTTGTTATTATLSAMQQSPDTSWQQPQQPQQQVMIQPQTQPTQLAALEHKNKRPRHRSSSGSGSSDGGGGRWCASSYETDAGPHACACFAACLYALQVLHGSRDNTVTDAMATPSAALFLAHGRTAVDACTILLACPRCSSKGRGRGGGDDGDGKGNANGGRGATHHHAAVLLLLTTILGAAAAAYGAAALSAPEGINGGTLSPVSVSVSPPEPLLDYGSRWQAKGLDTIADRSSAATSVRDRLLHGELLPRLRDACTRVVAMAEAEAGEAELGGGCVAAMPALVRAYLEQALSTTMQAVTRGGRENGRTV